MIGVRFGCFAGIRFNCIINIRRGRRIRIRSVRLIRNGNTDRIDDLMRLGHRRGECGHFAVLIQGNREQRGTAGFSFRNGIIGNIAHPDAYDMFALENELRAGPLLIDHNCRAGNPHLSTAARI